MKDVMKVLDKFTAKILSYKPKRKNNKSNGLRDQLTTKKVQK